MATIEQKLADAETAYHNLMTGTAVVEVRDGNGELVRYNAANSNKLSAYIAELKRQLGVNPVSGPMRVWF